MSLVADLGGIFIVLNVTALALRPDCKYERNRTFGNRLGSDQFRRGNGPSQFVYLQSRFENIHTKGSCVVTRFRLTRAKNPD